MSDDLTKAELIERVKKLERALRIYLSWHRCNRRTLPDVQKIENLLKGRCGT